ncbi:MAG: hypothetical protein RLZZ141_518 [Pseudomonadota bacterium]|jgi:uncharacterized protein YggE
MTPAHPHPFVRLSRAASLGLLLTGMAIGAASAQTQPTALPLLHLSASGEVKAAPDRAAISVGVRTLAPAAAQAMAQNRERMAKVMATLIKQGVAARDIQTSAIDLSPQYIYVQNEPPKLTGYQASNALTIMVNDLPRLGPVLDAVVEAGVNQVNGISFGLKNAQGLEDAARLAAVKALKAKADLYAGATGHRTVRLVSLSEGGGSPEPRPMVMMAMAKMSADSGSTPVSGGELTVRIDVSGDYALVP